MKSLEKGLELEKAFEVLEKHIIQNNPQLNIRDFSFTPRFKKTVDGVPMEIDLYIVVNKGTSYESTFLVECKNWDKEKTKKVSPTEIRDFIDKIETLKANKGIFVGTVFTKGAISIRFVIWAVHQYRE